MRSLGLPQSKTTSTAKASSTFPTSALVKLHCSAQHGRGGRLWAVCDRTIALRVQNSAIVALVSLVSLLPLAKSKFAHFSRWITTKRMNRRVDEGRRTGGGYIFRVRNLRPAEIVKSLRVQLNGKKLDGLEGVAVKSFSDSSVWTCVPAFQP